MDKNIVGWFEIPVENIERAVTFYETVFGFKMSKMPLGVLEMAIFPMIEGATGAGGALVKHPDFYHPSQNGNLLYFTAQSGDLSNELSKVAAAGGTVLIEKRMISEDNGYMGVFLDTEGNRVALHSKK